ncbi:ThiF family protein [Roseovarius pacificus]|uniref:ThiF family protein n=1 Tax=Roseovarius pacificus TaxID=337701 RepID=A0A1M7IMX9_9RHOB|nr:Mov34/MPN/PAD-1 family protein [Roseovarius pacificus]SHM41963.1 ThiF family protein [Roseovarius pacificus]
MPGKTSAELAEAIVQILLIHPEVFDGRVISDAGGEPEIQILVNVEMPLPMKAKGQSPNGIRTKEPVTAKIPQNYPWKSPRFNLRDDFPRNLPHLQPIGKSHPPQPCLVDGHQDEFFRQFDLHENGLLQLIDQLIAWLEKAATDQLNNAAHGWEPVLRAGVSNSITLNAAYCRQLVRPGGGISLLSGRYLRSSKTEEPQFFLSADANKIPLKKDKPDIFTAKWIEDYASGNTVVAVVSPPKLPTGKPRLETEHYAEYIENFEDILARGKQLGCYALIQSLLTNISRYFDKAYLNQRVPVGLIFCIRRPFKLTGMETDIELIPYIFEIFPSDGRKSILEGGGSSKAYPAAQIDAISKELLCSVSGTKMPPRTAILGCGSVGSKAAFHLARTGGTITSVSDSDYFGAHNMARHALVRDNLGGQKANELAKELATLDQSPRTYPADILTGLSTDDGRKTIIPPRTQLILNTTASLGVREALCQWKPKFRKARVSEIALFGHGEAGIMLLEAPEGNPNLCDLMASFHAEKISPTAFKLLHDSEFGLSEVQIGQGCHSASMPMSDMRLSILTGTMVEELLELNDSKTNEGKIVFGFRNGSDRLNTQWATWTVPAFEIIPIAGSDGWKLRVSKAVLERIRVEMEAFPGVETGGVIVGTCSSRLRTICVVDTIPAPEDSERSAAKFILGEKGLKKAIERRFQESGEKLLDLGTWHSHVVEVGPSSLDWTTAADLAKGRPPPSVLLIATPTRLHAISKGI